MPTKPVFEKILTKAFCQCILSMMSKKKLGSFNDSINDYFQSFIYVCHDMKIFWPASFVKFPWYCWTEFIQSWKDLMKTLRSHGNLQSLTDLINGANIGTHSNSRDWLFWMFMMSKINPLMKKSVLLERYANSILYLHRKSRNAIPKFEHIIAPHVSSTSTFTRIVQTVLCWFHRM